MAQSQHKNTSYQHIEREFQQIFAVKPNDLRMPWLTALYKWTTGPLKRMPFIYFVPLALCAVLALYLLVGPLIIRLASILQYGF